MTLIKCIMLLNLSVFLSCSPTINVSEYGTGVGTRYVTASSKIPYVYINGFVDFEIKTYLRTKGIDSTSINELRFNAVYSALYTKKLMFDKFGAWDKEIWTKNERHPILIWEKRKLFIEEDDVYSVVTSGEESDDAIYASVLVFDEENRDCFSKSYPKKNTLIDYFSREIVNLNSNQEFYDKYWRMVFNYNKNH